MKATKKQILNFYKRQNKTNYFNNGFKSNSMLLDRRHNALRVISTPEFPVPYYQRITRALPSSEQQTLNLLNLKSETDENVVIKTKEQLSKTSEGLKVLEFVENKMALKSYSTNVQSVSTQAEIYTEDLINYMDSAHDENHRILNSVDLGDCLRVLKPKNV